MMSQKTTPQQRGMTFANFLLAAILVVLLAIFGMKIVPAYIENRTIAHILETIAHDPEMQDAQPAAIRDSFYKRTMVNNITVVNQDDLQIQKTPIGLKLSVKYNVKIGLAGNASLLLEFDTSSSPTR